jgi:hypothetical protein
LEDDGVTELVHESEPDLLAETPGDNERAVIDSETENVSL